MIFMKNHWLKLLILILLFLTNIILLSHNYNNPINKIFSKSPSSSIISVFNIKKEKHNPDSIKSAIKNNCVFLRPLYKIVIKYNLKFLLYIFELFCKLLLITLILNFFIENKKDSIPNLINICQSTKTWQTIFIIALLTSLLVLLKWINLPLSDIHGFRQSQTAITAMFLPINHFNILSYQTPALGAPWAIPFEVPFYQLIVAILAKVTHMDLNICGRLISWLFYAATLYPISKLSKKLDLDKRLFYIIATFYLISPIYLFFSRTFMIETTTVFFGSMFLLHTVKIIDNNKFIDYILCLIFSLLCILSKVTTYPTFFLAGLIYLAYTIFKNKKIDYRPILKLASIVIISLIFLALWIHHSDSLKAQNPFGEFITSKALSRFNFGTLHQRFSLLFYQILFGYLTSFTLGSMNVLIFSIISFLITPLKYKKLSAIFIFLYLVPVMTFANLYFVHNYYQVANAIFLITAIGIAVFGILKSGKTVLAIFLTLTISTLMLVSFKKVYCPSIVNNANNYIYRAGTFVKNNTNKDSAIIVFGMNWSSEINYYSQRKGLAAADFVYGKSAEKMLKNFDKLFDGMKISSIVYCKSCYLYDPPSADKKIENLKNTVLAKYPQFKEYKIGQISVYK